jgi:hypothetical protein
MRLRDWLVDFVGRSWSGLVWCFTTFTRPFGVLAWAQCDKRGCDVHFFSLLFSSWKSPSLAGCKAVLERKRTPADLRL